MIVARWAFAVLFLMGLIPAFFDVRSWWLFAYLAVMFFGLLATVNPGPWIKTIPPDHPDALGSLDLRERESRTHL